MNITLTPSQESGLAFAAAQRNAANPTAAPMTSEQFAADLLGVKCDQFEVERIAALKAVLGEDDELLALGQAVKDNPDKRAAVVAAVQQVLAS